MGPWGFAYLLGVYVSVLICLYAAFKIGRMQGWKMGLTQALILIFFVVAYWLLESWAHVHAPFYGYPQMFPDMVPYFDWTQFGFGSEPGVGEHSCSIAAGGLDRITLSVPLLEAAVTFTLMWTTRLLLDKFGWAHSQQVVFVAPFLAGLAALALDAFLDPIVSQSFNCDTLPGMTHPGLGFWRWFATPELAHFWFGIPAFNYAAWYSAPVLLITFILLAAWIWEWFLYRLGFVPKSPGAAHLLVRILIFLTFAVLHLTAPGISTPDVQVGIILLAIVVSLIVAWTNRGNYSTYHKFRWEFFVPLLFFFTLPVLILLLSGVFVGWMLPWLLPISLVLAAIGIVFAYLPYSKWFGSP